MRLSSNRESESLEEEGAGTMYMESPIVRARELRRHDLLEEAARHRMTANAIESSGNDLLSRIRSSWVHQVCRARGNLARRFRAALRLLNTERATLAER
jgi:hypothetical protein